MRRLLSVEEKRLRKKAQNARWYRRCREAALATSRRWRTANPEKAKMSTKNWKAKNRTKVLELHKNWRDTNPAKILAWRAKQRANRRSASVPLTPQEQAEVIAIYAKARALTELIGEPYHVDHIKPISKGGLHHPSNLQVLRGIDNLRKGNKA